MYQVIEEEYNKVLLKRDEIRELINKLETEEPKDAYTIRVNRDRLAFWEGKSEGLKFALDNMK